MDSVKSTVVDLAQKASEPGAVEQVKGKVKDLIPAVGTPVLKSRVASADVIGPTPQVETGKSIPESDKDHVDCIATAREAEGNSIDSIKLETIEDTDPNTLTDSQRKNWREFFRQRASHLMTVCITLWSEPIKPDNADRRNQDYRGSENRGGCIFNVERKAREDDVDDRARWKDTLELLNRPYLSLSIAERMVLREQLDGVSDCDEFYPQLFTGRWVPISR